MNDEEATNEILFWRVYMLNRYHIITGQRGRFSIDAHAPGPWPRMEYYPDATWGLAPLPPLALPPAYVFRGKMCFI